MKIRKEVSLLAAFAMIAFFVWFPGAVSGCGDGDDPATHPRLKAGSGSNPSWAFAYDSAEEMCTHSELIVTGQVREVINVTGEQHLYHTYWTFKVEDMIKGEKVKEVTVVQMGSEDVPGSDFKSDPLFIEGDKYLLFLREGTEGVYYCHPQGRFYLWEDHVYAMNYVLDGAEPLHLVPGLACDGEKLDNVAETITGILDSPQVIFTRYPARSPGDVMRYNAGTTFEFYALLATGNTGSGTVTISIDKGFLPDGIKPVIRPDSFDVEPYSAYETRISVYIDRLVEPGSYRIPFTFSVDGVEILAGAVTLNVSPPYADTPLSYEELIAKGLKIPGGDTVEYN